MTTLEELTLAFDSIVATAANLRVRSPEAEECFKRGLAMALDAITFADQHEGRKEQVTPAQPRLSEQEQSERRKLDVPPPPPADADGWVEWDGTSGMPKELRVDTRVDVMSRTVIGICLTYTKHPAGHINWGALSQITKWRLSK